MNHPDVSQPVLPGTPVSHLPLSNRLYAEVFGPPSPARTTSVNCLGPQLRYEIGVVAVRPG